MVFSGCWKKKMDFKTKKLLFTFSHSNKKMHRWIHPWWLQNLCLLFFTTIIKIANSTFLKKSWTCLLWKFWQNVLIFYALGWTFFKWKLKDEEKLNLFPQMLHWICFSPVWTVICSCKPLWLEFLFPQILQIKALFSVNFDTFSGP